MPSLLPFYDEEDDSNDELNNFIWEGLGSIGSAYSNLGWKLLLAWFFLLVKFVLIVTVVYGLVFLADLLHSNPFFRTFFTNCSAGVALFFLNGTIFSYVKKKMSFAICFVILIGSISGVVAYFSPPDSILQNYLISVSTGYLLLLALDILYVRHQNRLVEKMERKADFERQSNEPAPFGGPGGPSAIVNEGD